MKKLIITSGIIALAFIQAKKIIIAAVIAGLLFIGGTAADVNPTTMTTLTHIESVQPEMPIEKTEQKNVLLQPEGGE